MHVRRIGQLAVTSGRWLAWMAAATLMSAADAMGPRRTKQPKRANSDPTRTPARTQDDDGAAATAAVDLDVASPPAKVTVTPTGLRIIDKRKISVPPTTANHGPAVIREARIEPAPATVGQKVRRVRQAIVDAARAFWFPLLGRLIRAARRTPLPTGVSDAELGRYAWQRTSCRQLLCDKPGQDECWSELINLAADETAGDWRLPVVWWLNRHVPPVALARLVAAEVDGRSGGTLADRRLTLALRLAGHAAAALPDREARAALGRALALARRPVNPYESNGPTLVARSVAATLLEQRPELDELVQNSLALQKGESRMEPDAPLPVEARLLAIALRNRAHDFGTGLTKTVVKAGLGPTQLEAAARLADATLARPPRLPAAEPTRAPMATAGLGVRRVLPWLTPPLVGACVGAATNLGGWKAAPSTVSLGESIALLALLAAVNVFTVQLSASRLPGVVARLAGQPWQLFFSYSAVLTLMGLAIFRARAPWVVAASSWATLATLMLFVVGLLATMFLLLRRTDAGRAAAAHVTTTLPRARAAGRRLGRIQATAVEMREALETIPAVKTSPEAITGEWSQDVAARTRGFFLPSRAGIRRLLARSEFSSGMRLRIIAGLGRIVNSGETIASLVPGRDQTVNRGLARQAGRQLRTHSCRYVEEVATGAVALTRLALDLAKAGDIGTANTVAQNAVRLIGEHTGAARAARTQMFRRQALRAQAANPGGFRDMVRLAQADARARDTQLVPVVPALRDSLRAAVASELDSRDNFFDVQETVIKPLLSASGEAEAAVSMLTFAVPSDAKETSAGSSTMTELLRLAGVRALELGASLTFEQVLERLDKLSRRTTGASDAVGITSVLAATACRFDVKLSRLAIDNALAQIAASSPEASARAARRRASALWRVGAAGLACGALSIAVYVARKLFELGEQDLVIVQASDEGLIATEAARASVRGGYLGEQAMDSLASFGTFLSDLAPLFSLLAEGEDPAP
jgi:hypothetical protein